MVQRRVLLGLLFFCAFAGPAFGQIVSFLDAQGNPASVYLEGSRAWLRVEDPAANLDGSTAEAVLINVSAALSGDAEQVILDETGPDTGVFTGSLQLQRHGLVGNGLITSRDTSVYPYTFDTLTATYGAATANAGTVGSTVAVLNASGNDISSFVVGDTVYFRVRDALANSSPSVDTTQVDVMATVRNWGEYQPVYLTETGGDTGVFEGSVPTVYGIDPVQHDGVIELEPGDVLWAWHNDANGETYSSDEATAVSVVPVTITFLDWDFGTDRPISEIHEFSSFRIRATDGAASGQGSMTVRVSSDLRGDEELATLWEDSNNPGTFYGSFGISATLTSTPPATDGLMEVTEIQGPPHQFDTVRATPETCSISPCPTAVAGVIGSSVRFLDSVGEDTQVFSAGDTVTLEVRDYTVYGQTTATLVSQSGDSETVSILSYFPYTGLYRGSIVCEEGPPVPGDGRLQVHEPDTITASHLDPFGFSSSTATASVASNKVIFLDRFGNPADFQFESGWARVQARNSDANLSSGTVDVVTAILLTVEADGNIRDSESLQLTETGPDTSIFTGQMKLSTHYAPQPNDGRLDSWYKLSFEVPYSIPDDISASVGTVSAMVPLLRSKIWLVDANGADATQYPAGSRIYIRLESEGVNFDPAVPDTRYVVLANPSNQDIEYPLLTETGPNTSIFEGSYATNLAPAGWDGVFNVQPGDTFRAVDSGGYAPDITDEAGIIMPPPPDAVDDTAALAEDGPAVSIPVLANDVAAAGLTLSVSAVTQGARGTAAIQGNGTITYTPNANANGSDSFSYTVTDSLGLTDTATVSITISAVNDPPKANDDSVTTPEDTPITIQVLANDTDVDGDPLTVTFASDPNRGDVVINPNGTITYTPATNLNGLDLFVYDIQDPSGQTSRAVISVTVTAVQDPPVAGHDSPTTPEDTPLTINALANDSDPDGDTLNIASVAQPETGNAVITADNKIAYTPAANFFGLDRFNYTISDGHGNTSTNSIWVLVTSVNDLPTAIDDAATTNEGTAVVIAVLANDSDVETVALTLQSITQPAHGTAAIGANNTVTYTPAANYNGSDSFTYVLSDNAGGTDTASVSITITAVNDAPDAINDAAATNEDVAVTISVLANDIDVDGDSLTVTSVTQGTRGAVVINGNGTITYTPNANTNGADAFTYTARDGAGLTDTATVTVNVAAVNDPPDAVNDTASTVEGAAVSIPVLANDTDLEGNALSINSVGAPNNGTATNTGNGSITYTPTANFTGTATFTYTIGDGNGGNDTATVTVTVRESFSRVAVLGTNSVWLQSGSDVLSGDVVVNQAGAGPFLNGSAELSVGGTVTTPAGWDVQADSVTIASGATVASDLFYNQLTNNGTVTGPQSTPLTLPVFVSLPAFQTATPESTDVNVAVNGTLTLAAGSYRDLIVGRKGTVTFTGGVYHFRNIQVDREAKLYFSAASEVRVQQKMSTKLNTTVGPATGASITAANIVFHVAGVNGTSGGLAATPKAVDVGTDNVFTANIYAPNGTIWLESGTQARGAFLGRDVNVGIDVQVTLQSAW